MATSSSTYESIEKLIQFQNSFLNLIHSQVLSQQEGEKRKQALLKLQVLEISDKNDLLNEIINTLKRELIQEKIQCDSVLKSYFTKLLELDYLPLLHVNRYELTKLSIFGFDIYIDPLEAILQILNRLQRILYILEDNLKNQELSLKVKELSKDKKSISQILLVGWKEYYCFLHLYKLNLNIYMLKQYINIATTSLPKKDKEIIFTGVYNLYKRLIPILTQYYLTNILQELADLNNMMYNFHPSFDYFNFYTYIQPVQQHIGVFNRINEIQKKCTNTNILTPLLFGIMNNYKSFLHFISSVQSTQYTHLLRALLSGLIINFKLRILQYNQVLSLVGLTINKLCLLNKMKFSIITSDLSKQWHEAKEFFISAFKSGYNPGQIQTWTLSDAKLIQPTIIGFLIKGLLLTQNCRNDQFLKRLQRPQLEEMIENQIKQLTDGTQTLNGLISNWKLLKLNEIQESNEKVSQNKQKQISSQINVNQKRDNKALNLVRVINLISILDLYSQRLVYSILSAFNNLGSINSQLVKRTLQQGTQTLNEIIAAMNRKEILTNLKDILPQFHLLYPPKRTFEDIVPVYLHSFITRQAITNLVTLVAHSEQAEGQIHLKQVLIALVHKYFVKPQQQLQHSSYIVYKSFDKQYKVPSTIDNMNSQANSVFSSLVKLLTTEQIAYQEQLTTFQILYNLLKHSPHHIIEVLNLPAIQNQKISSFLEWLINSQYQGSQQFTVSVLSLLNQFADKTESNIELKSYLEECYYLIVLDSILSSLSKIVDKKDWHSTQNDRNKVLNFIYLFVQIYDKFLKSQPSAPTLLSSVWSNLLELISYLLENSSYQASTIINCCQLYWKIINIVKSTDMRSWYHKLAINRIFSTLTTQNLIFNQTFKGVTLINSLKNYMISKSPTQTNTSINYQRYSFSDIKLFFENNFSSIFQNKNFQESVHDQFAELTSVIQAAKTGNCSIKSQIHISGDKEIPPCLSEQNIKKLYEEYCKIKCESEKQKNLESLQFSLHLLILNPINHKNLWNLILKSENKEFLSNMTFTRQTINEVLQVMRHLTSQQNKSQNSQSSSNSQLQIKINSMLGLDFLQQNINELQLLASGYYFDASKLETFLKHKQVLWFLIACNNSNWREFNEVFSNYLKNTYFLSTLLQYKEYLTITHQAHNDYEKKVEEFSVLIDQYLFYVQKKLESICMLKTSDSQKQNEIRKSTLLINVKVLLIKCEMQKILQNVKLIVQQLQSNSLPDAKFIKLLSSVHNLNRLCNKLMGGNIKLPDFVHHNLYTTGDSEQKQFLLGNWIEQCEDGFEIEWINKFQLRYVPDQQSLKKIFTLPHFQNDQNEKQLYLRSVLETDVNKTFEQIKNKLKDYLELSSSSIAINQQSCTQVTNSLVRDFYLLGYLYFIIKTSSKNQNTQNRESNENLNLSPILQSLIKRKTIQLQLIKQIDSSAYHHLKLLIINHTQKSLENISQQAIENQQQIKFLWKDKQLIPNGQQTIVTDETKDLYIQLIAEQILGKPYLELNNSFALGYLNASFNPHLTH